MLDADKWDDTGEGNGLPMPSAHATQRVQVNLQQIRLAMQHDPEMFINFFMAEQLTFPVPEFHKEIFHEMTHAEVNRLVMAIPRAHNKTTLCKLTAVWYFLFSDYRFILYVTGSAELVVPYVNDIIAFMESDNFRAVFGELDFKSPGMKRQDGIGVYKFRIVQTGKICILRGLGTGQRVRGINVDNERPQLGIVDDAEDDDSVETELAHKKTLRWWYGAFIKCLNPIRNKLIVSGNLLARSSLLYKLLTADNWRSFLYGAILSNGKPLWGDVWTIEALRADFREYQRNGMTARWFAEMMNQPMAEGGSIIQATEICYKPMRQPREIAYGFLTVDPAISKNKWGNRIAVAAHGWIAEDMQWQIVETFCQRGVDPILLFDKIIAIANRWNFRVIGIEAGSMQEVLVYVYEFLKNLKNWHEYSFVPVTSQNVRKPMRIGTWAAMLKQSPTKQASYALTQGEFHATQQLLSYEPMRENNDDDLIDTIAYGPQMVQKYMAEILKTLPNRVVGSAKSSYDVASI